MHAFLSSTPPNLVINFQIIPNDKGNISIDEIKNLQKSLSILPPKNKINIAVIIDAHKLTIPAQNAFLKTLEEPPSQSEIYLITDFPDKLLSTILSRVEIIESKTKFSYTSETLENSRILFKKLQNSKVGERLAVIDEAKFDRDSFLHFLSDLEFILHENLSHPLISEIWHLISQTKTYTQANSNLRLVIDYFAINLVLQ